MQEPSVYRRKPGKVWIVEGTVRESARRSGRRLHYFNNMENKSIRFLVNLRAALIKFKVNFILRLRYIVRWHK